MREKSELCLVPHCAYFFFAELLWRIDVLISYILERGDITLRGQTLVLWGRGEQILLFMYHI